ncbi:MAG: tRNA dihydrouridine synthase DusB, partial [Acidimicrobiia bacterium]|nr:tRNA dihydrouridine synthase DusB [Acidimicrobiia bacterium]
VVLAPMAGVTNAPFRRLCRELGGDRASLYVCEMVGARSLVSGDEKTRMLARFPAGESPRSIQLYGTDHGAVGEAVAYLVQTEGADHIDLNFGCPVPKVTRNGGGAALPWRRDRLRSIVAAAVANAGDTPITIKIRTGIDKDHPTFLDAGRIAEEEGAAAVALHARTAYQLYSGKADWSKIRLLKEAVRSIPVLGNGDIWEAADAVRMMDETGCDGVVVGRGCLGRPWLFGDLSATLGGKPRNSVPRLEFVVDVMVRHAELLCDWFGDFTGIRTFRKHTGWYLKGYPAGPELRAALASVEGVDQLRELTRRLDGAALPHEGSTRMTRGHSRGPRQVKLPHGYLAGLWDLDVLDEVAVSGG